MHFTSIAFQKLAIIEAKTRHKASVACQAKGALLMHDIEGAYL